MLVGAKGDSSVTQFRRAVLTVTFTLAAALSGPAQTTKPSTTRPAELDALIGQLGSGEWKERDAAQKRIVDLGQPAVASIDELAKNATDPEVRQRARDILRQIQGGDFSKPSLVTLHFKNARPVEVYQSLDEQAHAKLTTWPPNLFEMRVRIRNPGVPGGAKTVTIDLDKVPFWKAMIELEEQTGLAVRDMGNDMQLADAMTGPRGKKRNACVAGPYMVVATENFGPDSIWEIVVFAEPRLNVLVHARQPDITEAVDKAGKPIDQVLANIVNNRRRGQPPEFDESGGNAFSLHLNQPLHNVGRVSGTVRAVIATKDTTLEIEDVAAARNVDKVVEGRRVLLNVINPEPNDWLLSLVVYNSNPPVPGLEKMRIALTDAKGVALQPRGSSAQGGGDMPRMTWLLVYQQPANGGPPAKLSLTVPNETRQVEIPFAFGDKPAPKDKVE
jgi:hypothetical protein